MQVHDGGEIEPAFICLDVRYVADPDLIGRGGDRAIEEVIGGGSCGRIGPCSSRNEGPFLKRLEAQFAHDAPDAFPGNSGAFPDKNLAQTWSAICQAAVPESGSNPRAERLILAAAAA